MRVKILVTGASGFVGSHVVTELIRRQRQVIATSRSPFSIAGAEARQVTDLCADTDWRHCLGDVNTVIHCAARVHVMHETAEHPLNLFREVNVAGTIALAEQAAQSGVSQFIFMSSIKVNGEATSREIPFQETDAPKASDPYGISKAEAEVALQAIGKRYGMAITIIRPPLVYGRGVGANFLSMLRWVKKQIPLPLASINNLRSFVYVRNLADLIAHCVQNPKAYGEVFFVSDGQDLSTPDLLKQAACALQLPSRLFSFPPRLLILGASLLGKRSIADRLCQSLRVDTSKARQLLDWQAPYSLQQGLGDCIASLSVLSANADASKNTHPSQNPEQHHNETSI